MRQSEIVYWMEDSAKASACAERIRLRALLVEAVGNVIARHHGHACIGAADVLKEYDRLTGTTDRSEGNEPLT